MGHRQVKQIAIFHVQIQLLWLLEGFISWTQTKNKYYTHIFEGSLEYAYFQ